MEQYRITDFGLMKMSESEAVYRSSPYWRVRYVGSGHTYHEALDDALDVALHGNDEDLPKLTVPGVQTISRNLMPSGWLYYVALDVGKRDSGHKAVKVALRKMRR